MDAAMGTALTSQTEPHPSAPRRVLFVDDEPSILQGLARMLRPLRHEIIGEYAPGGKEALAMLALEPFDVVVADMRMPGMDGAALLREVQKLHPQMIRIIFSGHAEVDAALRALPVAHQYIAKPCDAVQLRTVISRAIGLSALLEDEALRSVVAGLTELPAQPKIYLDLTKLLRQPDSATHDIAKLVERDAALSAKLLKIVNSAFFGPHRRISSIEGAVQYLGTNLVRSITLASSTSDVLATRARKVGYDIDANQREALLSAHLAAQFFLDRSLREDAFSAALLQNVGKLVLVAEGSEDHACAMEHAANSGISVHAAERELGVVSHAHVGAYLLGAWNLPYPLVEAVAHHHEPESIPHEQLDIVDAVYAGTLVAQHYLTQEPGALELATRHIERFGATDALARVTAAAEHWLSSGEGASG
jgi:HD-like signal output (HDOD) protein/ActR/RegA family two-component response regulator